MHFLRNLPASTATFPYSTPVPGTPTSAGSLTRTRPPEKPDQAWTWEGPHVTETTDTPAENAPAKKRAGGLNGMLLPELKQMAGGLGIKGAGGMRKSQLIEAIKAAQSGGQSAGQSGGQSGGSGGQSEQSGGRQSGGESGGSGGQSEQSGGQSGAA